MLMRTELMHTAPSDEFDRITEGLGEWLSRGDITATHGVLTITLPVAEQAKPRKIEVTREGGGVEATEAALAGGP
jgi:HSP20 family protein